MPAGAGRAAAIKGNAGARRLFSGNFHLEIDGARRHHGGDGMFVHHLGHGIAQQHDILVERFDLPLKLMPFTR